jgi:hypothetical protein
MPARRYKIWSVGNAVGQGATKSIRIGISGIAKKATPAHPYIVVNEIICNSIARTLLLPCPPGALVDHNDEPYFFCLDFNLSGQSLPPVSAATLVAEHPRICWGVILFDTLVMNIDRHAHNLAFDQSTNKFQIFDHSHALLGPSGNIETKLTQEENNLAIGGHCLAAEITTKDGMSMWMKRIEEIPDFFLDGIVQSTCEVGLPDEDKLKVSSFLKNRKRKIKSLVESNVESFPKLLGNKP